jgi:mannosyltransferase
VSATTRRTQYPISKLLHAGLLLLVLLLALSLRVYRLDAQSLWNDEGTSVAVAQRDLITIARDAAHDIHPPLYYWLLSGWVRLFGTGEAAVRSLSALLGVAVVALTYALGRGLAGRWIGLAAAFLVAVNPFQVYYSQEARMYMLLAALAAGAMLALVRLAERESIPAFVALVALESAGLYTHYAFVFAVLILNLAYALWLVVAWRRVGTVWRVLNWTLSQVAVILIYLPWLPTAIRQATAWPSPEQTAPFLSALVDTWRWLVFGPTIETNQVVVPLLVAGLLALLGVLSLGLGRWGRSPAESRWSAGLLALWLALPVALMFVLGLYREAYLKFLLITTPALVLLLACGLFAPLPARSRAKQRPISKFQYPIRLLLIALILIPTFLALRNIYTAPAYARDDYRGIAAYVEAVGRPGDAVLLNAPGQQEVWNYYYHGDLPVHPLPEERPLDPAATESALAELARPGGRVFAVLWATDESDPQRIIEGWLDTHAYKALESWYGNVRLVVYAVPERTPETPDHTLDVRLQNAGTGDEIALLGYSLLSDRLAAGDIAAVTLFWQAERTPVGRYKVFLHVLDGGNHIVGQRDAEPGGGAHLTTLWNPGEVVADNHGIPIHPATPPGVYRVEVGMYDPETGQRLTTPEGASQVWLEPLAVERPAAPAPIPALGMQHVAGARFDELTLLGYDAYGLGFAHQPEAPLQPGDVLHISLYWQADAQPRGDWQVALALVGSDGQDVANLMAEPVMDYPTSNWQAGDTWRGQFNLVIPGDAPTGRYQLQVQPISPGGTPSEPFLSEPLAVQP